MDKHTETLNWDTHSALIWTPSPGLSGNLDYLQAMLTYSSVPSSAALDNDVTDNWRVSRDILSLSHCPPSQSHGSQGRCQINGWMWSSNVPADWQLLYSALLIRWENGFRVWGGNWKFDGTLSPRGKAITHSNERTLSEMGSRRSRTCTCRCIGQLGEYMLKYFSQRVSAVFPEAKHLSCNLLQRKKSYCYLNSIR